MVETTISMRACDPSVRSPPLDEEGDPEFEHDLEAGVRRDRRRLEPGGSG